VPAGLKLPSEPRIQLSRDVEVGGNGLDFADVPDLLDADGVAEWQRLGRVFQTQPTRFREGDRAAVTAYAAYWSAFRRAASEVAARGPLVEGRTAADRDRLVKNPATVRPRRNFDTSRASWG
jgi:phage terminase small subunit